jgi:ABC-2 type transport system permease protein
MKDVVWWELRQRRKAIFWWTFGSVLMTVIILALFPSIRDKAADMNAVINQLPKELRGLKTGGAAQINVGDPAQFLNSQLFYITLPMIWIILAITRGSGILGREEQAHTLELLLARPISRSRLLAAKLLAFTAEFGVVALATFATLAALCPVFGMDIHGWYLFLAAAYTALFCFSYGFIAFALQAASMLTKRMATVTAVALGFGGYLLASLSSLTDWLEWPVKAVPYHYFDMLRVLQGHGVPRGLLVYLALVFILGTLLAFLGFCRRDIE